MIDLAKLKRLEAEATKGEWKHDENGLASFDDEGRCQKDIFEWDYGAIDYEKADADLIAESRNAMPEMLKWIEDARMCLKSCRGVMDTEGFEQSVKEIDELLDELKDLDRDNAE